jgi:hypothetical protein
MRRLLSCIPVRLEQAEGPLELVGGDLSAGETASEELDRIGTVRGARFTDEEPDDGD